MLGYGLILARVRKNYSGLLESFRGRFWELVFYAKKTVVVQYLLAAKDSSIAPNKVYQLKFLPSFRQCSELGEDMMTFNLNFREIPSS